MGICRSLIKPVLSAGLVLAIHAAACYSQTRPGIHAFVTPPEDCYVTDPVVPESIYSFLRVQILALSLAQRGEQANIKMLETKGGAPFEAIDKTIAGLRQERIENTCASFVVAYYVDSKDTTMATVAKYLDFAYGELGKMSNQMLGLNLQMSLHKINGPSPQRQLSMLLEKRQQILGDMTSALNLTLDLLIDEDRPNAQGKPDHLILKKEQVNDLLDYLSTRFPALRDSQVGISGDFAKQAALIQKFLTGGYRPADVP